tara:strand:+ start:748 stop:1005 length:258 start_codon:yes stop_codon:yes gene_type:complete
MIPKVEQTKMFITNEIVKHDNNPNYWRSKEHIYKSIELYQYVLQKNIVTQDWFDERSKHTYVERLQDLLEVIEFINGILIKQQIK